VVVKRVLYVELRLVSMSYSDRSELVFFYLFGLGFWVYVYFVQSVLHLLFNIIGRSPAGFV
jgi:hypothetical protein